MKTFSLSYCLLLGYVLVMVSCNRQAVSPPIDVTPLCEPEVYFEYEDLLSGETGVISGYDHFRSSMFSHGGVSSTPMNSNFRQQFYFTYRPDSNYYPRVFLAFYPMLNSESVVAIPGQYYGQLYTYEDPQDFVTENFPLGDLLNTSTNFFVAYEEGYERSGRAYREDFTDQTEAYLRITESAICQNETDQPLLYVQAEFAATVKVIDTNSELFGQDIFRISNGRFAFTHDVSIAQ